MANLRHPINGCPWDIKQNFKSIAPYTIEEAYEVADAIESGDHNALCDELGDLLLQVIFLSRIAEEEELFTIADVARTVSDKMIRRHPHVFSNQIMLKAKDPNQQWEEIKKTERKAKGKLSILDAIPVGMAPLQRAIKLQKRAADVGFDWPNISQLLDKMREEAAELVDELEAEETNQDRITDEVGDLLFVAVNLARKAGVDPETALIRCNKKFERRFSFIEEKVKQGDGSMIGTTLEEMERLWNEAKDSEVK